MVSLNTAGATGCPTDGGCLWGEAAVLGVTVKGAPFTQYSQL